MISPLYIVNVTELWNLGDTSDKHYPFSCEKLHEGFQVFCSEVYFLFS